ncbi:MAG: ABC transporter ATP-binding protein [Planctomycetes bacterium]|nr:ABC transporter ATP-binding protein [Planctomycetota bacterium]
MDSTARSAPVIEVKHLRKRFAGNIALEDVSLTVGEGEIFGFIGPNGAGKTTTIRILATLLEPTAGQVRISGLCVQNDTEEVRRIIGYMPDQYGLYDGLTVEEYLEFFAGAYRIPPRLRRSTLGDVMDLTDLGPLRRRMVSSLSRGMKQRLCLAKTLIHDPRLLILDEPAAALDPRARIELRMLLKELRRMGKTIFISSHILTELSDICTSVGIIEKGRLIECGSIDQIKQRSTKKARVEIHLHEPRPEAIDILKLSPEVERCSLDGKRLSFDYLGRPEDFHRVLKLLVDNRIPLLSVAQDTRNLEHLFMELTKGDVQ